MPHGKETYGSKVGRPQKKQRQALLEGGQGSGKLPTTQANQIIGNLENMGSGYINPYSGTIRKGLDRLGHMSVGDKIVNPNALSLLHNANNTLDNIVRGTVGALIPGGSTPLRDRLERRRRNKSRGEEQAEREIEALAAKASRKDRAEGGEINDQMNALAISVEPAIVEEQETHTMPDGTVMPGATHEEYEQMLPDEEMEEDYVDYVVNSTLDEQDKNYLESALAEDAKLSEIFDQVIESATEFSGSGPIEGPGNEKSDSIPARLSDGEFVITAKATEEIGADNLMSMMKDAEAAADERQSVAYGGMIDEEDQAVPLPTQGSRAAQGNVPNVVKQSRQVEEEMLKSSPRRYYVPVSG